MPKSDRWNESVVDWVFTGYRNNEEGNRMTLANLSNVWCLSGISWCSSDMDWGVLSAGMTLAILLSDA